MNSAQPEPRRRSALFKRADVAISSPCVALSRSGPRKRAVRWKLPSLFKTTPGATSPARSEEHTSELQSPCNLVCRLLLEKKKYRNTHLPPTHPKQSRYFLLSDTTFHTVHTLIASCLSLVVIRLTHQSSVRENDHAISARH